MLRLSERASLNNVLNAFSCWPGVWWLMAGPVSADTQSSHLTPVMITPAPGPGESWEWELRILERLGSSGVRPQTRCCCCWSWVMTAYWCDGLPDVTRIISPGAELPWPCDNTQSRPEPVCVTSVTRVSNLSHLSSNPSLCWGAVSHSHQAQPALTLGLSPSETAACVQCPHSAGARLTFTTEILAPSRRGPIMKSFEYLHNYLSTKTIHVIRLADFVMILELPWATSDLISFWLWAHEVQLSLESPGV